MIFYYIIESVPSNLSKLEIARFLYIKLGSIVSFSTKINNTDTDNFYRLINMRIDPKSFNDVQINCFTWAQLYSSLLSYFGISNRIIKYWHAYVNFYIDDVVWVADSTFGIYTDLSRIQYGDETSFFGPCIYQKDRIDSNIVEFNDFYLSLINQIDDKLGYSERIKKLHNYKLVLNNIKNDINFFSFDSLFSKIEFLFKSIGCLSFGYYEAKEFVYELEKHLFNCNEIKNIGSAELRRLNTNDEVDIIQCIFVRFNDEYRYYILCPNLPIKRVSIDDIISLSFYGFLPYKKQIPGVVFNSVYNLNSIKKMSDYSFIQTNKIKRNI